MIRGAHVTAEREALGLSQEALALAASVDVAVIDRVERNLGKSDEISRICGVLRFDAPLVKPGYPFGEELDSFEEEFELFDELMDPVEQHPVAMAADVDLIEPYVGFSPAIKPMIVGLALMSIPAPVVQAIGDYPGAVGFAVGCFAGGFVTFASGLVRLKRALERVV